MTYKIQLAGFFFIIIKCSSIKKNDEEKNTSHLKTLQNKKKNRRQRENGDSLHTYMTHGRSFSWLGTGTSIKSGGV